MIAPAYRVFVDIGDITKIAGVGRSAVSNWRKRHADFPLPNAAGFFDFSEVERWLIENGKISGPAPRRFIIWRLADTLGEVIGTDETTRFVISTLVYLEACARSAETTNTGDAEVRVEARDTWDSVRRSKDADLASRFVEAATTVERSNPALDGLVIAGVSLSAEADAGLLRTLLDTIEEAANDEVSPRFVLLDEAVARVQDTDRFRGEFATPRELTHLMVRLGECSSGTVFDPAAGEGGLLLMAALGDDRDETMQMNLIGYEVNHEVIQVSRARFFLYGFSVDLRERDVFRVPTEELPEADLVLLDPPLGQTNWGDADIYLDDRWSFGVPPPKSADFAWLQLAVQSLGADGRAVVLAPAGATFRGGREASIRSAMLDSGAIEAVILLPPRLRTNTSIPLTVWVLCPPSRTPRESVLLVDASSLGERGRSQHLLDEGDIDLIVGAVRSWRSGTLSSAVHSRIAWAVPVAELQHQGANLDPARFRPVADVDSEGLRGRANELRSNLKLASDQSGAAVFAVLERLETKVRQ